MENRRPKVFFRLNRRDRVGPERVHGILHEVHRRMGNRNTGAIGFGAADRQGYYWVAFERDDAADVFERLHRDAGGNPNRQRRAPKDLLILTPETAEAMAWVRIIQDVTAFLSYITGDPRRRAAQWN